MRKPTHELFTAYRAMFDHFNRSLFAGELPEVVLNFSRMKSTHGFFAPERWQETTQPTGCTPLVTHEISLNPETSRRSPEEVASTLVHEMVHLWQQVAGKPSRTGYHNKQWAQRMREVGLVPVSIDQPGSDVGQKVTHTVADDGPFKKAFLALPANALPWTCSPEPTKDRKPGSKNKVKYECEAGCGAAAWGKPGLHLWCGDCDEPMSEV